MEKLKRLGEGLLDALYPKRAECMGCGTRAGIPRDWLCEDCRQGLASRWIGAAPPPEGGSIAEAAYGYRYGGPAVGMVHNLKYRGVTKLAEPMGRAMCAALEALEPVRADCVAAVPMHPKRLRERGFNHAELLARQVAERRQLPFLDALERRRDTPQQARLSDAERLKNLRDAFAARTPVEGRRVLLVDDVCTTGATANECAAALLRAGAASVTLLCYARAGGEKERGR